MFEHELNIQVIVFAAHLGNRVVYQGVPKDKRIYLYYTHSNDGGHFDTVVKVPGLLSRGYFCHLCLKGYDKRREHSCKITCKTCQWDNCSVIDELPCTVCNMTCRSQECQERHQKHCHKA